MYPVYTASFLFSADCKYRTSVHLQRHSVNKRTRFPCKQKDFPEKSMKSIEIRANGLQLPQPQREAFHSSKKHQGFKLNKRIFMKTIGFPAKLKEITKE